jgi:hypothetical protein
MGSLMNVKGSAASQSGDAPSDFASEGDGLYIAAIAHTGNVT